MNTKKLKLISLLEETNKSVKDNGSSILVEGLIPSEAEKIRQSFYKDGLDITPQEDGSFEFSFNKTESGSDDDVYNMFRDNDYSLESDYDEENAILSANDECNGEICSSENSDDISGILSVCTDYQVEPECIDLYSDNADKLVDYSINYDVCPEETCGAENSVENTEELEQPVAVEQDYYFNNDFSGVDAGVIGFEENPETDMGIINLADDHSAKDYDEEVIDPSLIDNIEKENNRDIKDYLTVESVEEDEKLSDENIEPALKKLLVHNKEVLFGADSKKLSDYKAKIEKLDIEKLKDFADEDMPTWRKHIEKYIGAEELNESTYNISKSDNHRKEYYYIDNGEEVLTDEDGNTLKFPSYKEAQEYIDSEELNESSDKTIYKIEIDGKNLKKIFTNDAEACDYAEEYLEKHKKDNIEYIAVNEFVNGEYIDDVCVIYKSPELNESVETVNLDEAYNGDVNSIRDEYYKTENRDAAISNLLDIGEAKNEEEAGDMIDDWDEKEWKEANGYYEDLDEAKDENTIDDSYVVRWYGDKGSFESHESYANFDDAKKAADEGTDATGYAQVYNSDDKELKNLLYDTYENMLSKQDEEDYEDLDEANDFLKYLKNEENYEKELDDSKELLTEFETDERSLDEGYYGDKVIYNLDDGTYLEDYDNDLWTPSRARALRLDPIEARDTLGYLEDKYDNLIIE